MPLLKASGRSEGVAVGPAAQGEDGAGAAKRPARNADLAAVEDQQIGRARPALPGDDRHELLLDHQGVVATGDPQPVGDAQDVGVHGDPEGDVVGVADVQRIANNPAPPK